MTSLPVVLPLPAAAMRASSEADSPERLRERKSRSGTKHDLHRATRLRSSVPLTAWGREKRRSPRPGGPPATPPAASCCVCLPVAGWSALPRRMATARSRPGSRARCAPVTLEHPAPHDGQKPRPFQDNAVRRSDPRSSWRAPANHGQRCGSRGVCEMPDQERLAWSTLSWRAMRPWFRREVS